MTIGSWQQRLAVFLISLVIIFIEITLMRELALRFWEHLAWLVISIALLGIGGVWTLRRRSEQPMQLVEVDASEPKPEETAEESGGSHD